MTLSTARFFILPVALSILGAGVSLGAEIQKLDNNSYINNPASWGGNAVPGPDDIAVWGSGLAGDLTNTLGGNVSFGGLKVTNTGGTSYIITSTGLSVLTIGSSGIDMSTATADLTIGAVLNLDASQTWTVASGRTLTMTSNSSSGTGTITLAGSGTFAMNSNNAFGSGTLNLNDGVHLSVSSTRTIYNAVNLNGDISILTGAFLTTFAGGMNISEGSHTITVSGSAATALSFSGGAVAGGQEIGGPGQLVFENGNGDGSSMVNVRMGAGAQDYPQIRADVSIGDNVSVFFQVAQIFTADSDLTVQSGGVFNMSNNGGSSLSQTIGSLAGAGSVTNNSTVDKKVAILTIDGGTSNKTTTFSGNITTGPGNSSISITKQGASTQILSGTNTYYGQTLVNAGTLLVSGTHIDSPTTGIPVGNTGYGSATSGHYIVASGAILGGDGLIAGNNSNANNSNMVLVQSGGILAPGEEIGTLKLDGGNIGGTNSRVLNMATGAKFSFDLAGDGTSADQIALWHYANGDVLLNANKIDLTLKGPLVAGTYTVTLFSFYSDDGTTSINSGITSGLALGVIDPNISGTPTLNYNAGGHTIDLTYTVIPEPQSWALLGLGFGVLLWSGRRRLSRI